MELRVRDVAASRRFYTAALAPLGIAPARDDGRSVSYGRGSDDFGLQQSETPTSGLHVAFAAASRELVDAFYREGLGHGGRSDAEPGIHAEYHPGYYAAFLLDPDGNVIEAVFHDRSH